jgi:hypothetical protein
MDSRFVLVAGSSYSERSVRDRTGLSIPPHFPGVFI